ncbi:unnamed protein product, partial [Didymodactylos carnosus]
IIYLDDILIYSKNEEDHLKHIKIVLDLLRKHQLFAKKSKCEFGVERLEFLGHIVSPSGISVDDNKVIAVKNWPTPKDLTHVRSFVGTAGFYRRFIKSYGEIAAPLTDLMRDNTPFVWTLKQQTAFIIHHSTGKTPFYMVYGIEPKLPGDKLRPLLNDKDENDTQAQIQQLDKQRALVDQRLHSNANKMKIYYDKHLKHQNIALKEGEWVLIHNEQGKKFKPHWIGPYKIRKICPLGTYQLQDQRIRNEFQPDPIQATKKTNLYSISKVEEMIGSINQR